MSQVLFSKKENPIIAALEGKGIKDDGKLVRAQKVSTASAISYTPSSSISSIFSKMVFSMSNHFHMDYWQLVKQMEPVFKPLQQMFENLGPLFAQLGDEGEDLSTALTVQMGERMDQMAVQLEKGFKAVGVKNHQEFREKQERIGRYKAEAGRGFFKNRENRALLAQIDKSMVKGSTGQLSLTDQRIIEEYWEYIGKCRDGYETHEKGCGKVASFSTCFLEHITSEMRNIGIFTDQGEVALRLKAQFYEKLKKEQEQLQREATGASKDVAIVNHYQILLSSIIIPPMMNAFLRLYFEDHLALVEKSCKKTIVTVTEKMVQLRKECYSRINRNMEFLKNFIDFEREYGDREMTDNLKGEIEEEVEIIADPTQIVIRERAEEWAAYAAFKREFDSLKSALPKDTPFEALVRKQFKMDAAMQKGGMLEKSTDEMMLDFSQFENPAVYFYEKLQKETEDKAAEWKEFLQISVKKD